MENQRGDIARRERESFLPVTENIFPLDYILPAIICICVLLHLSLFLKAPSFRRLHNVIARAREQRFA